MANANASGSQACTPCPAGWSCGDSSASPQLCAAGLYSTGGALACTLCPAQHACPAGSSEPLPCEAGTFAVAGSASCSRCPAGSYRAPALPMQRRLCLQRLCSTCSVPAWYVLDSRGFAVHHLPRRHVLLISCGGTQHLWSWLLQSCRLHRMCHLPSWVFLLQQQRHGMQLRTVFAGRRCRLHRLPCWVLVCQRHTAADRVPNGLLQCRECCGLRCIPGRLVLSRSHKEPRAVRPRFVQSGPGYVLRCVLRWVHLRRCDHHSCSL